MNAVNVVEGYGDDCPFPFFSEPAKLCKVYHDGGHYIATRCYRSQLKPAPHKTSREAIDILFDSLYSSGQRDELRGEALTAHIKAGLAELFADHPDLDGYIEDKIKRARHNLYVRKKRFRRKAYLNKWNYFVTFTYDDGKQNEETFRKRLRKCLSNLHVRRGWRYMGVFERAPETGRLHFHGIFYVPAGEMLGTIEEKKDYSTAQGRMQTRHENDFFVDRFGRNDFEEMNAMELKRGQTLDYVLKYIGKTGERIVYSRGIPTAILREVNDDDIVTEMQDYGTKFILWDNLISWECDVMNFKPKQMSLIDLLCNPRRVA